jgi:hypothetical protein
MLVIGGLVGLIGLLGGERNAAVWVVSNANGLNSYSHQLPTNPRNPVPRFTLSLMKPECLRVCVFVKLKGSRVKSDPPPDRRLTWNEL